jgi:hypothetical protein
MEQAAKFERGKWELRLSEAVAEHWKVRRSSPTAVRSGRHMEPIELLLLDFLTECGVSTASIFRGKKTDIPGYFRPEKNWDILIVERKALVLAIELKSQAGNEIGKNYYNRVSGQSKPASDGHFKTGHF